MVLRDLKEEIHWPTAFKAIFLAIMVAAFSLLLGTYLVSHLNQDNVDTNPVINQLRANRPDIFAFSVTVGTIYAVIDNFTYISPQAIFPYDLNGIILSVSYSSFVGQTLYPNDSRLVIDNWTLRPSPCCSNANEKSIQEVDSYIDSLEEGLYSQLEDFELLKNDTGNLQTSLADIAITHIGESYLEILHYYTNGLTIQLFLIKNLVIVLTGYINSIVVRPTGFDTVLSYESSIVSIYTTQNSKTTSFLDVMSDFIDMQFSEG